MSKMKDNFAEEFQAQLDTEMDFQVSMSEKPSYINDGEYDAVVDDSKEWVATNLKAIKGFFKCNVCEEDVKALYADPGEKDPDFECKECVTHRVMEDLLETIYN